MAFGSLPLTNLVQKELSDRLDKLVDAVYDRQVVPLTGAGVSVGAVLVAKDLVHSLAELVDTQHFGVPTDDASFARVAELAIAAHGAQKVVDRLGVATWAEIIPTRAHRYLAMLAADGFIDELITTNYDGGIENAWAALKAPGQIHVITDATELHQARSLNGGDLHLYKINGCAKKLNSQPAEPETILLTDSQLQGFQHGHARRWVRDLLRTTARSRTLVLSGFGSDEPQVWQVVRLILEELGALDARDRDTHSSEAEQEPPPRLWVALYGDRIPFHLVMALVDEAKLHGKKPLEDGGEFRFDNVFSKRDSADFGLACGQGLDAGAFWRRVWIEVLLRLLTRPEGPVPRAFVHAVTGRSARRRPEDTSLLGLWTSVVDEAFKDALFLEPEEWNKKRDLGSPGITWAEDRYVSPSYEPEYWVAAMLLSLVREEGDELVGRVVDQEPVPELRRSTLGVGAAFGASVSVTRDAQSEKIVLHVVADPFSSLRGAPIEDVESIRSLMQDYVQSAYSRARRQDRDARDARRTKVTP